ncbi:MAG: hypothetical protein HY958_05465 [Bacteroidia bacterium]|nr:hypothetical protein [Bacteroidia bacterium]
MCFKTMERRAAQIQRGCALVPRPKGQGNSGRGNSYTTSGLFTSTF